jgi:hypothetical protein
MKSLRPSSVQQAFPPVNVARVPPASVHRSAKADAWLPLYTKAAPSTDINPTNNIPPAMSEGRIAVSRCYTCESSAGASGSQ